MRCRWEFPAAIINKWNRCRVNKMDLTLLMWSLRGFVPLEAFCIPTD